MHWCDKWGKPREVRQGETSEDPKEKKKRCLNKFHNLPCHLKLKNASKKILLDFTLEYTGCCLGVPHVSVQNVFLLLKFLILLIICNQIEHSQFQYKCIMHDVY